MMNRERGELSDNLPEAVDTQDQITTESGDAPAPVLFTDDEPLFEKRRRKGRKPRGLVIALSCCAVALATLIVIYYFAVKQRAEEERIAAQIAAEEAIRQQELFEQQEYERMANSTTFLEGVSIEGVDIGNMTRDEAKNALLPVDAKIRDLGQITLTYGTQTITLELSSLVTSTNLDEVLSEAWNLARTGTYEEMTAQAEDVKANGRAYTLEISGYNGVALTTRISEIAAQIDKPVQDASVSHIDTENRTIEFADEQMGESVQQEELLNLIANAIERRDLSPIAIPMTQVAPVVSKAELQGKYQLRATATTSFSDSSSERKYNIRKGADLINGTVLKPGEEFSTNDKLGTRTTRNGWKMAGAYENGTVVEQAGGGVCQLSSTLYNAVVKGDLEVVYRRNHSMPVKYVDKGLDATINSVGNMIDFEFKNSTASDVVVFAYTIDNKKLTFEIWGVPFATDEYDEIKLTSEQVSVTEPSGQPVEIPVPEGTEKPDGTKIVAGERYTAVAARKGYVYQSYKHFYKNGTEVRVEKLATSTYKSFVGEIWVGPELQATPEPVITPDPGIPIDPLITSPTTDAGVPAGF